MASMPRTFTLFPTFALPKLGRMRGRRWSRLVERVANLPATDPEHMAYTLMMRRLSHLVGPRDSHVCFEPGCVTCALDVLKRYQGSERDLMQEYHTTLNEVKAFVVQSEAIVARRAA